MLSSHVGAHADKSKGLRDGQPTSGKRFMIHVPQDDNRQIDIKTVGFEGR